MKYEDQNFSNFSLETTAKIKVLRKVYVSCLMLFKEEPLRSAHLSVNGMTWLLVMLEADVRHVVLRCLLGAEFVWPLCPPFTLLSLVTGVTVAGLVWGTSPRLLLMQRVVQSCRPVLESDWHPDLVCTTEPWS